MRRLLIALTVALLTAAPATAASAAPADDGRRSYTGTIGGADYRVEMPERWNGTLLLYSHGYFPADFGLPLFVTNAAESEQWLLEHGFALAASQYQNDGIGYLIEPAMRDQLALLDWFEAEVGRPERTVVSGQSLGATIATLLAERHPRRFDGVLTLCGVYDPLNTFNSALDINFTVRTLLAPGEDIDLVHADDPVASREALIAAVNRARVTPEGRARLALAASFGNVTGWYRSLEPKPADLTGWIQQQTEWITWAKIWGNGPTAFADIERVAGGNPLGNTGIDYAKQLKRSSQREVVLQAYREAGLNLTSDLAALAAAPRIAPERDAVRYMYRYGVPTGRTPAPVLSLHTTGDGGAPPDQERWYAEQVDDPADLRQLWVERGGHCSFSAAEEVTALRALLTKLDTGRWPDLRPSRLNAAAGRFDPHYQQVLDLGGNGKAVMPPAFTRYRPPVTLRPSRTG
ncbi:alpha/beta hydrolase [Actinoplanes aureus]|uniref:Prolyl oligopeptidase family serine peptidase n=1 Tax=Actinoplanes aureus TaxID=2792083 RepID=A0A931CCI1_9ACTN|nr:alpha/beta hydrolase-fold protein [Actinoplanes aureus]MBG0564071.1 prolyl oligopeptidase family serine peptidase [Actinoplanes aureus]